ncbi:tryptophan-rich sensory protein [Actinotalea sp. K2]|uniref:tryptophan-rich sensory protein n=1 Tax=Actinotalea sp. K2 TaxID=2939438 RepID=UPI0020174A47|nr:tryptophan-rich sensory protein [Actinotalea sp. K2]MCL3862760.1 tryptophan-rich sensory protein [Actinotalea sp. K2]
MSTPHRSSTAGTRTSDASATTADLVRQVVVLVGAALAVVGAFIGSGAAGGPSQPEVGDGALAADATPVAPGSPAFSIWSVIYTGLVAYAIWQALPARRADPRQRSIGWWVLASMVLNAAWIGVVQADLLPLSVAVIVALVAVLSLVLVRLLAHPPRGRVEAVVVDGTLGLYLGWVCVATVANVAAVLAAAGVTDLGLGPDAWSVVALALAAVVGVALAVYSGGRLAIGAAIVWGLTWVAVARTTGDLLSTPAAVAAGVGAAVVAVVTVTVRLRGSSSGRTRRAR